MRKIILNTVKKTSPNYKKYYALVDNEDFKRANEYNWSVMKQSNTMYAQSYINEKLTLLHNFILGFIGVDHKDMNGLNCQKHNMRKATKQQNGMNRNSLKNSSSKFKGVYWYKRDEKWRAQICHNYKVIYIGYFDSEIEAAKAYNKKAKELFGKFAKLNKF